MIYLGRSVSEQSIVHLFMCMYPRYIMLFCPWAKAQGTRRYEWPNHPMFSLVLKLPLRRMNGPFFFLLQRFFDIYIKPNTFCLLVVSFLVIPPLEHIDPGNLGIQINHVHCFDLNCPPFILVDHHQQQRCKYCSASPSDQADMARNFCIVQHRHQTGGQSQPRMCSAHGI